MTGKYELQNQTQSLRSDEYELQAPQLIDQSHSVLDQFPQIYRNFDNTGVNVS